MPEPRIKAIFTDIGEVLLTNGWDSGGRKRAAQRFHLDLADMDTRHHLTFDTYEIGKVSLDTYLDRVVFYLARDFTRDEFKAFMFEQSQPYPEMIELIRRTKERNRLKLAVVSNEGRELNDYRIRKFGLAEFVDFFVSSCYVHFRKPDTDIFQMAIDMAQTRPEETVYLDDRALFVEVARGMRLHAIHHTGYESTRDALSGMGL